MTFINGKTMILHGFTNGYAIGAFSAHNIETVQAILDAALEERSPVMIQIGQKSIQSIGLRNLKNIVDSVAKDYPIPVSIHLDHSREYTQVLQAIQLGFQSVMFDGSVLEFDENLEITKKVAEIAASLGIGSEGEIGKIGGTEDDITVDEEDALITTVEEAKTFVDRTNVDYLAISIGTAHGVYKNEPRIRFDRLSEISKEIERPIVLHGGSGVPDDQILKAISLGVAKINVDTELRQAFIEGVQKKLAKDPENYVIADVLGYGKEQLKQTVREKIKLFGSANKADELLNN